MLKPAHMQKVAVVGTKGERPRVVSLLYDMGVLHIEPLSKEAAGVLKQETDAGGNKEVSEELLRIRSLEAALPPMPVQERRKFSSLREVIETAKSVDIDAEVSRLKEQQDRLSTQLEELASRAALVNDLQFVKEDLSIFDLEAAVSFYGSVPASNYATLIQNLPSAGAAVAYSAGSDPVKVIVTVPRAGLEKFGSIIQKADVRLTRVPAMKGTSVRILAGIGDERRAKEAELSEIASKLLALSQKHFTTISQVAEQLSIEVRQLEVLNNFGFTDSAFAVEGWVPSRKVAALRQAVAGRSSATKVFEIDSHEEAPTLLENPKRLKFFESFIRFYSIPLSHELDPSLIFALAFPIFFGLMLGDVGYAVVIFLISLWIIRRVNHLERPSRMPRALRSFAGRILQPAQFKKLAKAMMLGSVSGVVMGFIVNSYFGFPVNQYLFGYLNASMHASLPADGVFLDPISTLGLKLLLLYSGYIGLFMVSLGLVVGMLNAYWAQSTKHIIGKFGWLCTAWGIALTGLALLHHGQLSSLVNPISNPLIFLILVGIGLVIYGEGGQAIIELPSIVSNIISFTRLLGILLASFVLAYLIDNQVWGVGGGAGSGLMYGGVAFAVLGVVLFVMVHVFNIILGILEPGIQGARLIYVETFSKFLHGGGKPFAPFKGPRTYTLSETET